MNSPFALLCRVTLLAAASLAGLLRAQTYVIDSNISDWGINATTLISSTARSQYIEDFVGAGGLRSSRTFDVGDAGAKTKVVNIETPPARTAGQVVKDEGNGAQVIFDYLVEKKLI